MKKGLIIATSAALAVLLSACGGQSNKHATTSSMHTIKTSQAAKLAKKTGVNVGWDGDKADQLRDYMADFGTTMQQKYDEVTAASDTNFMGVNLGQYIQDKKQVSIDGTTQAVKWLPGEHGGSKTKENILAVYADTSDNILYLFAKKGDTARVLVTQSAAQNGVFDVKETANTDIKDAFTNIMAGHSTTKPHSGSTAVAANSPAKKEKDNTNMDPHADGSTPTQQFPSWIQGTWYSYDQDTDDVHVMTFKNNELQYSGSTPTYAYDARHRDANDLKWQNGDMSATIPYRENNWIEVNVGPVMGHPAVNIRGWYQSAGAGETYYIVNQNVHGQTIPVITDGSGAGAWGSTHYFKSQSLAQQNRNVHFSSDQSN